MPALMKFSISPVSESPVSISTLLILASVTFIASSPSPVFIKLSVLLPAYSVSSVVPLLVT